MERGKEDAMVGSEGVGGEFRLVGAAAELRRREAARRRLRRRREWEEGIAFVRFVAGAQAWEGGVRS